MKITTKVVWEFLEDGALVLVSSDSYEYDGPVALCKKGREAQAANTDFQQKQAGIDAGRYADQYNIANKNLAPYDKLGPGQLTNAASAQLASDNDNIARTYNGMRQAAFASMGARGMGSAPSGFGQTQQNSLNQGQAEAGTGAFRNAQVATEHQKNFATQQHEAMGGQASGAELGNTGAATNSAFDQSKMGSTAGDVLGGVAGLAGAAGAALSPFSALGKTAGAFKLAPGLASGAASNIANGANAGLISGLNTYQPSVNKLNY